MSDLNPNALADIMEKTGETLSDANIEVLVTRFRAERAQLLADEQAGKGKKKSEINKEVSASKKAALAAALEGLDLGLDSL